MKIGVLFPAYNEEKNIQGIIKESKKYFKNSIIVVVDDGSTDKTAKIAKNSGAIVIKHTKNKGKGEAIKTGLKYFLKKPIKFIIIADADRQYSIKDSKKILKGLNSADFVMGYRNFSKIPFRHKLGNIVWRNTFNLLFGVNLKDTNCGLIGISKDIIDKIEIGGGYIIENCMLASIIENKIKFAQVPVSVTYKKKSGIKRGVKIVWGVLYFIITRGINHKIKKIFR